MVNSLAPETETNEAVGGAVERVEAIAAELEAAAEETEKLGMLSERSVKAARDAGLMRLLQPTEYGGQAAHPREFAEAVMATANSCGATGWVAGVVGVHPWEIAMLDPRIADEVWGEDPETWVASPYTPSGIADPVEGGFVLNGRWQFSSGTDHADWVFLGALTGDGKGGLATIPDYLHVILPRSDYEILQDSWNVIGLRGTGSKDVVVNGAFIPSYRAVPHVEVATGIAAARAGRDEPVYKLPFQVLFPLGITAAVIGIAEGALRHHLAYQNDRYNAMGTRVREDPYTMYAISDAAADIAASRSQLLDGITEAYDHVASGGPITLDQTARLRRNQVRCAWRAVSAVDEIFARSGGNAGRMDNPLQRYWRDAHMGLQHFIHIPGGVYHASALLEMGAELPDTLLGSV